jgi:hypothetical protein
MVDQLLSGGPLVDLAQGRGPREHPGTWAVCLSSANLEGKGRYSWIDIQQRARKMSVLRLYLQRLARCCLAKNRVQRQASYGSSRGYQIDCPEALDGGEGMTAARQAAILPGMSAPSPGSLRGSSGCAPGEAPLPAGSMPDDPRRGLGGQLGKAPARPAKIRDPLPGVLRPSPTGSAPDGPRRGLPEPALSCGRSSPRRPPASFSERAEKPSRTHDARGGP